MKNGRQATSASLEVWDNIKLTNSLSDNKYDTSLDDELELKYIESNILS